MNFTEWRLWLRSKPLCLRWFIYLILARPLIDQFYYLKKISPLLSPLYIVGVLTPILIILSFNSRFFPGKERSGVDRFAFAWGIFILANIMLMIFLFFSIKLLGNAIKYVTPVLLFFYLRHFVRSRKDLKGILQTFLYSIIIPIFLFPLNYFFNPKAFSELSAGRGSGLRFEGGYADGFNYAFIIIGVFLVFGFFYLDSLYTKKSEVPKKRVLFIVILGCLLGLRAVNHIASWAIFIMLVGILFYFIIKSKRGILVLIMFLIGFGVFVKYFFSPGITPLLEKEIRVIKGEEDIDRSFNGRMKRWKQYFKIWEQMPTAAWFFGVSFSSLEEIPIVFGGQSISGFSRIIPTMVSGHMHSDYVRYIFFTGILGFAFYLLFLLNIFKRRKRFNRADRFLISGSIVVIVLYSITANPTLYLPLLYYIYTIFAYASLPLVVRLEKNEKKDSNFR